MKPLSLFVFLFWTIFALLYFVFGITFENSGLLVLSFWISSLAWLVDAGERD